MCYKDSVVSPSYLNLFVLTDLVSIIPRTAAFTGNTKAPTFMTTIFVCLFQIEISFFAT